MTKTIAFTPNNARLLEDKDAILERLMGHLESLRLAKRAARAPETGPDEPAKEEEPLVSYEDRKRLMAWSRAIADRRALKNGLGHLRPEDRRRLLRAPREMRLDGPTDAHRADEIAAILFEESPWLRPAIDVIWRDMRRNASAGLGLKFRPILLNGPPGIGKTHLARRLGELTRVPSLNFDVGSSSEGFRIAGLPRGWGTAHPSEVVETILSTGCATPIVFVDEIDKSGTMYSTRGTSTSVVSALLPLLEPRSAAAWSCPYFQIVFDMSHVNWILASNFAALIPEPLRTRVHIVHLAGMGHGDLVAAAKRACEVRDLPSEAVDDIQTILSAIPDGHTSLNMRTLSRLLADREEMERRPRLN